MHGKEARALRILAEYLEPKSRFEAEAVEDTIVFFGSARIAQGSPWYEAARALAHRLTQWSKGLDATTQRRFVVCTGGGPGIMEAANRGASEARGRNVGMKISLPREETINPHVTRELAFHFHYFFMRKFWLAYMAKAVIVFPGGFGTLDELFETVTLIQTGKSRARPILLFGREFWEQLIDFQHLVDTGMISAADLKLFRFVESAEEAWEHLSAFYGFDLPETTTGEYADDI